MGLLSSRNRRRTDLLNITRNRLGQATPYVAILSAIIGGSIALYIRHKNRIQNAKDAFGVVIQEKIAHLPDRDIESFYRTTKLDIKTAVSRVRHFLNANERVRIDRLWKEYEEIPAEQLDSKEEASWIAEFHRRLGGEYQHPRDIVRYYLDEFYKFAS